MKKCLDSRPGCNLPKILRRIRFGVLKAFVVMTRNLSSPTKLNGVHSLVSWRDWGDSESVYFRREIRRMFVCWEMTESEQALIRRHCDGGKSADCQLLAIWYSVSVCCTNVGPSSWQPHALMHAHARGRTHMHAITDLGTCRMHGEHLHTYPCADTHARKHAFA